MGWAALLFRGLIREDVIFYQVLLSSSSYWWQNSILSSFECVCMHAKSLQLCRLFATPWTVAHQAPLSVGFSRQEHWSGLQCPPPQLWDRGPFFLNGCCLEILSAPRGHPWVLAIWAVPPPTHTHNLLLQGKQEGFTVSLSQLDSLLSGRVQYVI